MRPRHGLEALERLVIEDAAILHQSAMPVGCVLVDTDVRHDEQPRHLVFECPDSLLYYAVRIVGCGAPFIFSVRNPEEEHGRNPKQLDLACFFREEIHRQPILTRHRADRFPPVPSHSDEERSNQIGRRQPCFPDHTPQGLDLSQSS